MATSPSNEKARTKAASSGWLKSLAYWDKNAIWVSLAAGLYPLLHYYNGNFDIADTLFQLGLMIAMCLLLPWVAIQISKPIFRFGFLKKWEKNRVAAINFMIFAGLLSLLIFHFNRKTIVGIMALAGLASFVLYKQLGKIMILQFLLAILSFATLIPRLIFMGQYDDSWTELPDQITETRFVSTPNVYLIQPDGFTGFADLREPPYDYPDTTFENWLSQQGFTHYNDFRSNYYSTLTSNATLFSMKHHYYQNTYPGNLKTYRSQAVIVGQNAVLDIFKNNGYKSHLLTDNSFFLTNRRLKGFDFCNIDQADVLFYDTGGIYGTDIVADFEEVLKTNDSQKNFFFIEKTIPSHIMYTDARSEGPAMERVRYLERLEVAHDWLTELINLIHTYDDNPLIIIAGDHGGYVGLNSVKETERRQLNAMEAQSVFGSLLTVRWPTGMQPQQFEVGSTVNLFRVLFAELSGDLSLLDHLELNESFLPLYDGGSADFYRVIDHNNQFEYQKLE